MCFVLGVDLRLPCPLERRDQVQQSFPLVCLGAEVLYNFSTERQGVCVGMASQEACSGALPATLQVTAYL